VEFSWPRKVLLFPLVSLPFVYFFFLLTKFKLAFRFFPRHWPGTPPPKSFLRTFPRWAFREFRLSSLAGFPGFPPELLSPFDMPLPRHKPPPPNDFFVFFTVQAELTLFSFLPQLPLHPPTKHHKGVLLVARSNPMNF